MAAEGTFRWIAREMCQSQLEYFGGNICIALLNVINSKFYCPIYHIVGSYKNSGTAKRGKRHEEDGSVGSENI